MAANPTSPLAPAKVLLLLLPLGRTTSLRFQAYAERLRQHSSVRLGDVTPDNSSASFSPLAFPDGRILYNIRLTVPSHSHIVLSPFETFRQPLVVIGVCDALEYSELDVSKLEHDNFHSSLLGDLRSGMDRIRGEHPRALVLQSLLFDHPRPEELNGKIRDVLVVPTPERPTTIKTIMADISSLFLNELSTLARTVQIAPPLDLLYNAAHGLSTTDFPVLDRAAVPFRSSSLRAEVMPHNSPKISVDNSTSHEGSAASSPAMSIIANFQNVQPTSDQSKADVANLADTTTSTIPDEASSDSHLHETSDGVRSFEINPSVETKRLSRSTPGGASDFAKSRLKARQAVIIGSLYLHAGRWPDALRELVDGATRARIYNDYLWHGKALENILVTMLLLSWGGFEYQIPQICSVVPNRSVSSKRHSSFATVIFADIRPIGDPSHSDTLRVLCKAIPELAQLVIAVYIRAANVQGEIPFQFAFSESIIRLARLISVLQLGKDALNFDILNAFVHDTPMPKSLISRVIPGAGFKARLCAFLLKAYPPKSTASGLSARDSVTILTGIASVFSIVDMKRNEAMANKQALAALVTVAKAKGEPGVDVVDLQSEMKKDPTPNPVVLLSDSSSQAEIFAFQQLVCQQFGVFDHNSYILSSSKNRELPKTEDSIDIPSRIVDDISYQSLGSRGMKKEILSLCADVSELLGDYQASLDHVATLLCVLRPSTNPVTGTITISSRTSHEEQFALADRMQHLLDMAARRAIPMPVTTYWDPFLVHSVEIQGARTNDNLFKPTKLNHSSRNLTLKGSGPFLHDALLKSDKQEVQPRVLVAGDMVDFVVTLRNLYEFDIVVESLTLLTDGMAVEQKPATVTLGPFRRQDIPLSGVPCSGGKLVIRGCKIRIRGCHEQDFLIFPTPWHPSVDVKTKYRALSKPLELPGINSNSDESSAGLSPRSTNVSCIVIDQQPVLKVITTSLTLLTISALQGETYSFTVTVQNVSSSIPINFLHVSFQHSWNADGQNRSKETFSQTQPLSKWRMGHCATSIEIPPGELYVLNVEVLGVQNLSQCDVIVDYAHLEHAGEELQESFFTRQVLLPVTVIVNASIDLVRFDVIASSCADHAVVKKLKDKNMVGDDMVLLLFDLRNSCFRPLSATLQMRPVCDDAMLIDVAKVIQPGQIERLMLLMPKISWVKYTAPLRTTAVEQTSKVRSEVREKLSVRTARCRELLLDQLRVLWSEIDRKEHGTVDLQHMELSAQMMDLICEQPLGIYMSLESGSGSGRDAHVSGRDTFTMHVDEDLILTIEFTNRTGDDVHAHIQVRPGLLSEAASVEVDMSSRLAWTGSLQRRFVRIKSHGKFRHAIGLCFLAAGSYEVEASVINASHLQTHTESRDTDIFGERTIVSSTSTFTVIER